MLVPRKSHRIGRNPNAEVDDESSDERQGGGQDAQASSTPEDPVLDRGRTWFAVKLVQTFKPEVDDESSDQCEGGRQRPQEDQGSQGSVVDRQHNTQHPKRNMKSD